MAAEMGSVWQIAGTTAALGMGVVFVSLFLLSVYLHYFKILTGRIEGKRAAAPSPRKAAPKLPPAASPPEVAPAPRAAGAPVAAAVAVGLHLGGGRPAPSPEVAAAIAAALALHRRARAGHGAPEARRVSDWRLVGRVDALATRLGRPGHAPRR